MAGVVRLEEFRPGHRKAPPITFFNRRELDTLLSLYSRRVATGEWRDYAIDHCAGYALFSVFRHSFERPVFSIAKRVGGGGRSGEYLLFSGHRQLASDKSLAGLLKRFEKKLKIVS